MIGAIGCEPDRSPLLCERGGAVSVLVQGLEPSWSPLAAHSGHSNEWIPTAAGRVKIRVNDLGVSGDHATIVRGFDSGIGAAANLVAEQTMTRP